MIRDILAYMLEYVRGEFTNIRVEVKLDGLRYPCVCRVC